MNVEKIKPSLFKFYKLDLFQELIYSAIGCGLFTIIYLFFPDKIWDSPYREAYCVILILSFFIQFLIFNQTDSRIKLFRPNYKRNIILFSILLYAGICFLFYNTSFSTNGAQGDNFYRTAYITKMANSGYPQDFIYKDFSAFYSPFYWYCLAIVAKIFYIKPYRMLKYGMLFMYYITPILLFEIWKKIYDKKISYIISILSTILLFDPYSPDHMLSYLLIVPFIMYYYENCTNKILKKKDYLFGGIIGSIVFCTYFLYFLIIPIYFLISLLTNKNKLKKNFNHIVYLTFSVILFSIWFIAPLMRDILLIGFESHQNHYFNSAALKTPLTYYFDISWMGAALFFGAIYIIHKYKISNNLRILGNISLSVIIVYLIGMIGILFDFPIMHPRFLKVIYYVSIISSSIFYVNTIYYVTQNDFLKKRKLHLNITQIETFLFITFIFANSYGVFMSTSSSEAYQIALDEDVRYDLTDIVDELDYENKVFLTSYYYVTAYRPIYLFLLQNPYYNHPSALYNERLKIVIELSECDTPKEMHHLIMNNKFGPIDYFWLKPYNGTDFVFEACTEEFPEGRDYFEITFRHELFENEYYFKRIELDGEILYKTKY